MSHEPNGVLEPTMDSASRYTDTMIYKYELEDQNSKSFSYTCPFYSSSTDKLSRPPTAWGSIDACKEYSAPKEKLDQQFPSTM